MLRERERRVQCLFTLPENTAFLVAAENESLVFSPERRSSVARNSPLEKTTQLRPGSLPRPNPHSNVMTHANPNHLVKHVFKHSAQWCGKAGCPIRSLGLGVSLNDWRLRAGLKLEV